MHFMNPVPLMTLVELIRGQATSDESMRIASELCTALGKTPVEAADYPGFIANRILMPMINEAIYAVMEGVGTPEAIDTVMKLGMNHPMGPLTLADFIGLDVCLAILERAARRPRRSEVPAVSAAAADGRGGPPRTQVRPGLLHVPAIARATTGPRIASSCTIASRFFTIDRRREQLVARSVCRKTVRARDEPLVAERPERLKPARRIRVRRRASRAAGASRTRRRTSTAMRATGRCAFAASAAATEADEDHGADAVGDGPVRDEQEIEIGRGAERGARQRQAVAGPPEASEADARRGAPGAVAGHQIGGPGSGESGQRMANWARHGRRYHGRFCNRRAAEAKVVVVL